MIKKILVKVGAKIGTLIGYKIAAIIGSKYLIDKNAEHELYKKFGW